MLEFANWVARNTVIPAKPVAAGGKPGPVSNSVQMHEAKKWDPGCDRRKSLERRRDDRLPRDSTSFLHRPNRIAHHANAFHLGLQQITFLHEFRRRAGEANTFRGAG